MRPFIKWAGGKARLLSQILPLLPSPESVTTYYEPFLGGGSVFLATDYNKCILSDANEILIGAYKAVQLEPSDVIEGNLKMQEHYRSLDTEDRKTHYYRMREWFNAGHYNLFIFLNKTCFNGLWRVSKKSGFNVPHGRYKNPVIVDAENIRAISKKLRGVELTSCDYAETISRATDGDFIYCDPPYIPESPTANFTSYTAEGFGYQDHVRLRDALGTSRADVRWAVSNSDTPQTRELYKGYHFHELQVQRSISANGAKRKVVNELLITNY